MPEFRLERNGFTAKPGLAVRCNALLPHAPAHASKLEALGRLARAHMGLTLGDLGNIVPSNLADPGCH